MWKYAHYFTAYIIEGGCLDSEPFEVVKCIELSWLVEEVEYDHNSQVISQALWNLYPES